MNASSLCGSLSLPVVNKLRILHCKTQPGTPERAQKTLPVLSELEDNLDMVLNCISINGVLMVGRVDHPRLPSSNRLRSLYSQFKLRLQEDPKFMRKVIDILPDIAAKYSSTNIMDIVGDDEFLDLLGA